MPSRGARITAGMATSREGDIFTNAGGRIRIVLAIAAVEERPLGHLDIEQAFTWGEVAKDIYIYIYTKISSCPEECQAFSGSGGQVQQYNLRPISRLPLLELEGRRLTVDGGIRAIARRPVCVQAGRGGRKGGGGCF